MREYAVSIAVLAGIVTWCVVMCIGLVLGAGILKMWRRK